MAVRAVLRSGFIKQYRLALNVAFQSVTQSAGHIGVRPCQRELSALIVVKRRRRPALVHVAIATLRDAIPGGELGAVRIRVTGLTIFWRAFELNLMRGRLRLVTFLASDSAM